MFELIAVLWVLSPLLLIPICLIFGSERRKMKRFIDDLYRTGRISRGEWIFHDQNHDGQGMYYPPQQGQMYQQPPYYNGGQNGSALNYPGLRGGENGKGAPGSVFKDESRAAMQNAPAQNVASSKWAQSGVVQPAAYKNEKAPEKKLISPEEQNRLMQQRIAAAEGRSVEDMPTPAAKAEEAPRHHHEGVDLTKPTAQQPAAAQTAQPTVQQPAAAQTVQPTAQQPASAQTVQPTAQQPAAAQTAQPTAQQPAAAQTVQPTAQQPAAAQTAQPTVQQPAAAQTVQPTAQQSAAAQTAQPTAQQPAAARTMPQGAGQYYRNGAPVYGQAAYGRQPNGQPMYGQQVYGGYGQPLPAWAQQRPPKPKRPRKHYSPATVLTGISITFIVLAGLIFSTAPWVNISDWTRVGLLGGQAALFFGMYVFMGKKLKIEGTSAAMYILGSVFTTIAYITTGYFGLFGAWFGIEGRGMMIFLSLGALLITLFSARAMKIFQKPLCEYAASISLAVSGTLLLAQFANYFERNYAAFAMLITAGGTLFSIIYYLAVSKGWKPSDAVRLTHKLTRIAYAVIAGPMLLADINKGVGYGWSMFGWGICLIYMGEFLWHAVRTRSERWLAGHAALVLAGALSLYLNLDDYLIFSLIVTLFAMAGGWTYTYLEKKGKLLFEAKNVYILVRFILAFSAFFSLFIHEYESVQFVIAALWTVDFAAQAAVKKNQALLLPQCVAVLNLLSELGVYIIDSEGWEIYGLSLFALITLLIGIVGTGLYTYLDKKGKALVKADAINLMMRIIMGLPCLAALVVAYDSGYGFWSGYEWAICGLFIAELTVHAVVKRSQVPLIFQFFFVAYGVYVLTPTYIGGDQYHYYERIPLHRLDFAVALWGICAVGTAVYMVLKHYKKNLVNADRVLVLIRVYTAMVGASAVFAVYYEWDWGWKAWLLFGGMAAEMLIYAIIFKDQRILGVHAVYLTGILAELYFVLDDFPLFALIVTALIAAATLCYFTLWEQDKLRFRAPYVLSAMRVFFGMVALSQIITQFFEWSGYSVGICAILAAETLYYGIRTKNQAYVGVHAVFLTLIMAQLGVLLDSYAYFVLICCGVAAVGTFAYYRLHKAGRLGFDASYVLAGVRTLYGVFCLTLLRLEWLDFTWVSIVIWAIVTAELTFYGLKLKNKWLLRAQGLSLMTLFGAIANVVGRLLAGAYTDVFIFAMLIAAGLVLYRIFRSIYTQTSDGLLTATLFGLGIALMTTSALPYGVITMFMVAVFVTVDAFDDKHFLSRGMQIVLPLPELLTAGMLASYLGVRYNIECRPLSMVICAGVLCAAAFILGLGAREEQKYAIMKYSTDIASGLALLCTISIRRELAVGVAVTLVSIALFAVMQLSRKNMHSLLPMMTIFFGAEQTARAIWYDPMREGDAVIIFSMVMTAILAVTSRVMFADKLYKKYPSGKFHWDIPQAGIAMCVLSCTTDSLMFSPRARLFIALLELTVFTANFMRRENDDAANRLSMTLATACAAAALVVRPFMVFENAMITTKIILVIITLFGLAVKKIWAENEKVSQEFSQAVFMAAYLLLIVDGLTNQSLANSLIVLSVSLMLLIFSFVRKTRRWFLVSAITLLMLTLYITGDFLSAVAWWAYLLLAGILLIVVAAMTEYFRQRSAKNPQEERFFVDWKW